MYGVEAQLSEDVEHGPVLPEDRGQDAAEPLVVGLGDAPDQRVLAGQPGLMYG